MYKGLFTLCSYLKTKESYDRWVTRRLWGFRHQISKEKISKYLKNNISKYLKKNISKCRLHISGSFGRTPRHCAKNGCETLRVSAIRWSEYVWPEKLKPTFPIRRQAPDVKYPEKVERHPARIPDVGYPEKMERRKGDRPRVHGVGTHPEQLHSDSPRGYAAHSPIYTPSGRSTRHSRTSHTRTIAYPIRICCLDHCLKCTSLGTSFRQPATAHVPPPSDGVSGFAYGKGLQSFGSSCFWAFHCFAMDSKELSSISDCFGDKKSYQNTKT